LHKVKDWAPVFLGGLFKGCSNVLIEADAYRAAESGSGPGSDARVVALKGGFNTK
jgi:hypothetical protein